ncbi:MAG: hypothetical protein II503_06110 [Clostridia bacterium]|nr:hypothetical protein [Clostridia bacterium]
MKKSDKKSDPEALIRAAKAGDGEAFEALSRMYGGMIGAAVSSFGSSISSADPEAGAAFSEEDLRQEAGIAFLRAVRTYDPDSKPGVTFGLYAKICVKNAMISLFRKRRTRSKRLRNAGGRRGIAEAAARGRSRPCRALASSPSSSRVRWLSPSPPKVACGRSGR